MVNTQGEDISAMKKDIEHIKNKVDNLEKYFKQKDTQDRKIYVTKDRFKPVEWIVYSISGLLILGIIGAILDKVA